jgi:hypothetical protein
MASGMSDHGKLLMGALYAGAEALDTAIPKDRSYLLGVLDRDPKGPMEARARAINKLGLSLMSGGNLEGSISSNWQNVKDSFSAEKLGEPTQGISDKELYGKIKTRMDQAKEAMALYDPSHPFRSGIEATAFFGKGQLVQQGLETWKNLNSNFLHLARAPQTDLPGLNVASGVWNGVAPIVEGFSSPLGLATGGGARFLAHAKEAYPAAKAAIAGMEGLFAGLFAKHAYDNSKEAKQLWNDPKSTTQEKVEKITSSVGDSLVALFSSFAALETVGATKVLGALKGVKSPQEAKQVLMEAATQADSPEEKQAITHAAETLHEAVGEPPPLPEQVKSPAVLDQNGHAHEGLDHPVIDVPGEKGFTTTDGRFVKPEEALQIAREQSQVPNGFKGTRLEGRDLGSTDLLPVFKGVMEGIPQKGIPDLDLFNLREDLGPHPANSTVSQKTLEKYGFKVEKGPDGKYSIEKPVGAKSPEVVDLGPRDSQVSNGTGVATPHEEKMLSQWKDQISQSNGGKIFGLANADVDLELEKMGLPKAQHGEKVTMEGERLKAIERLKEDPHAGQKLVDELEKKIRPLNSEENLLLVAETAHVSMARDSAEEAYQEALKKGDPTAISEAQIEKARARDAYQRVAEIDTLVGTSNAQGLALRRARLQEDYSLANMEKRLAEENPNKKLTKEQEDLIADINDRLKKTQKSVDQYEARRLRDLKSRTERSTTHLLEKLEKGDLSARAKPEPIKLDEEAVRLKAEHKRVRDEFDTAVIRARLAGRTMTEKLIDALPKWRRGFLLSSPTTLAKLIAAASLRLTETPLVEGISSALGVLPGVSKVKAKAVRYSGLNVQAEGRAITEGVTTGMEDAWRNLTTGKSNLDVLYGKNERISESDILPRQMMDFFGSIHGALKAPVKRAEFARSFEKRIQGVIEQGGDPHHPMVQTKAAVEAYKDAQRAIFMQDNAVVDAYKRALSRFDQVDPQTKKPAMGNRFAGTALRAALPIVKVPTNLVGETFEYATGLATGSFKLAAALRKGTDKLTSEQADLIMRQLSKGLIGSAVLALGYLNPDVVGGYYQAGEKRKPGDPLPLSIKIYGTNVPSILLHNPLLEALQIGATVRRVADSKLRKKDRETQGVDNGLWAGLLGLVEETPFAREAVEYTKLFDPQKREKAKADLANSFFVPAAVDFAARKTDTDSKGNLVPRKAQGALQGVQSGIPGLREDLPKRNIHTSLR